MGIQVTWYGHSAFCVRIGDALIWVDPFLSDNALTSVSPNEVDAHYILATHGHGDHIGDTVQIAKRTGALVISNFEICNWLQAQGVQKTHAQHIGGGFEHPFGYLKLTIAHHGCYLPDGSYGGAPAGLLLTAENRRIYFAGDTGLFYDMHLIGEEGVDLAVLPIGDNFTMGPHDALRAVRLLEPRVVIPIHYDTFELIKQDPHAWTQRGEEETETQVIVLEPEQSHTV